MLDTNSIIQTRYQSVKLAVALRTARSVVGWSQDELSKLSGIPKITIARFETLEGNLKAEQLMKLLDLYGSMGAKLELSGGDGFTLTVEGKMINLAGERLGNNSNRRADRKKGQGVF
jgi:transcriptional regulator with XRE-family HTH domain